MTYMGCCEEVCDITLEDLPTIVIAGMHVLSDWTLNTSTCCATITFEYNSPQTGVIVNGGVLVAFEDDDYAEYDKVLIHEFATVEDFLFDPDDPGSFMCRRVKFTPVKVIGGRVTERKTQFDNLHFAARYTPLSVTIIIGHKEVECDDISEGEKWVVTVIRNYQVDALYRSHTGETVTKTWVASGSTCWVPSGTNSVVSSESDPPSDPTFWDFATIAGTTYSQTMFHEVMTSLPSGVYTVTECMDNCTSCIEINCDPYVVTGLAGTIPPCVPAISTIYDLPQREQKQYCPGCGTTTNEPTTEVTLASLSPTATAIFGSVVSYNSTNVLSGASYAYSCSAGTSATLGTCDAATFAYTATGSTPGWKDWISKTYDCSNTILSPININIALPAITLTFS